MESSRKKQSTSKTEPAYREELMFDGELQTLVVLDEPEEAILKDRLEEAQLRERRIEEMRIKIEAVLGESDQRRGKVKKEKEKKGRKGMRKKGEGGAARARSSKIARKTAVRTKIVEISSTSQQMFKDGRENQVEIPALLDNSSAQFRDMLACKMASLRNREQIYI